jgi:hypothetical protein
MQGNANEWAQSADRRRTLSGKSFRASIAFSPDAGCPISRSAQFEQPAISNSGKENSYAIRRG